MPRKRSRLDLNILTVPVDSMEKLSQQKVTAPIVSDANMRKTTETVGNGGKDYGKTID